MGIFLPGIGVLVSVLKIVISLLADWKFTRVVGSGGAEGFDGKSVVVVPLSSERGLILSIGIPDLPEVGPPFAERGFVLVDDDSSPVALVGTVA